MYLLCDVNAKANQQRNHQFANRFGTAMRLRYEFFERLCFFRISRLGKPLKCFVEISDGLLDRCFVNTMEFLELG